MPRSIFFVPPRGQYGGGKLAGILKTGQTTSYGSGTGVDDGALQIGVAKAYLVLTAGQHAGNTNITINSKTDAHANACVFDYQTHLMWSRTYANTVGPTNDGNLPWTTTGAGATAEGIFPYVAAANVANLAGYSDWRIPNVYELFSLTDFEEASALPDAVAFPTWNVVSIWTSTTTPSGITTAMNVSFFNGTVAVATLKTGTRATALVRGG